MLRTGLKVLLLVVLLAVGYGLGMQTGPALRKTFAPSRVQQPGTTIARDSIYSLGKLIPAQGTVPVIAPPGDRVEKLYVKQLDSVKSGDKLALLASHVDREQEVKLARQQVTEAEKQLEAIQQAETARLTEIDAQKKAAEARFEAEEKTQQLKLGVLRQQLEVAKNRQQRVTSLDRTRVRVPAQETEQLALAVSQAQAELDAAQASLDALRQRRKREIIAAEAQEEAARAEYALARRRVPVESLRQSLKLAERRLEHTLLKAPVNGIVLRLNVNEGDPTGSSPLMELAAGTDMVALAEVYATDIDLLAGWVANSPVEALITSKALGDVKLSGVVKGSQAIGRSVSRNNVPGFSARADADRRVIEVRVDITGKKDVEIARRFIGLEVNVEFRAPEPAGKETK